MRRQGWESPKDRAAPRLRVAPGVRLALLSLLLLCLLLGAWTQAEQVNVAISGPPRLEGARVFFTVSVTGPEDVIGGLPPEAFSVTEAAALAPTALPGTPTAPPAIPAPGGETEAEYRAGLGGDHPRRAGKRGSCRRCRM